MRMDNVKENSGISLDVNLKANDLDEMCDLLMRLAQALYESKKDPKALGKIAMYPSAQLSTARH